MKTNIKILGLALIGLLILTSSCEKEKDAVEETLGVVFAVNVDASEAWSSNTDNATLVAEKDGTKLKITIKSSGKEVVLYAEKFEKGKFTFDDTTNSGVYKDGTDYDSSVSIDNYIEITNVHTDGKKFDAKFSFMGFNSAQESKIISGSMANITRLN
ncbi:MAG: hypothetical protein KAH25_07055 [Bacteroidales bacterium]|nr:hypothetical protein [Bacteroidales bacterium]